MPDDENTPGVERVSVLPAGVPRLRISPSLACSQLSTTVIESSSHTLSDIGGIDADIHTFTAGPRFTYRNEANVTPFAHALFGGARVSGSSGGLTVSDTGWAMNLGGGVDWNVNERFSVRLIQADALVTRFNGNREVDPRLSFGVVIKFGSK